MIGDDPRGPNHCAVNILFLKNAVAKTRTMNQVFRLTDRGGNMYEGNDPIFMVTTTLFTPGLFFHSCLMCTMFREIGLLQRLHVEVNACHHCLLRWTINPKDLGMHEAGHMLTCLEWDGGGTSTGRAEATTLKPQVSKGNSSHATQWRQLSVAFQLRRRIALTLGERRSGGATCCMRRPASLTRPLRTLHQPGADPEGVV